MPRIFRVPMASGLLPIRVPVEANFVIKVSKKQASPLLFFPVFEDVTGQTDLYHVDMSGNVRSATLVEPRFRGSEGDRMVRWNAIAEYFAACSIKPGGDIERDDAFAACR